MLKGSVTGGPSIANDSISTSTPRNASRPPSTVGKYAGPMRTAVPIW